MKGEWEPNTMGNTTFGSIVRFGNPVKVYLYVHTDNVISLSDAYRFQAITVREQE